MNDYVSIKYPCKAFALQGFVLCYNFSILSILSFVALIGGFEYDFQKKGYKNNETQAFCKKMYRISAWLGTYFPVRRLVEFGMTFYSRQYNSLTIECITIVVYLMVVLLIILFIEKKDIKEK